VEKKRGRGRNSKGGIPKREIDKRGLNQEKNEQLQEKLEGSRKGKSGFCNKEKGWGLHENSWPMIGERPNVRQEGGEDRFEGFLKKRSIAPERTTLRGRRLGKRAGGKNPGKIWRHLVCRKEDCLLKGKGGGRRQPEFCVAGKRHQPEEENLRICGSQLPFLGNAIIVLPPEGGGK